MNWWAIENQGTDSAVSSDIFYGLRKVVQIRGSKNTTS